MIHCLRTIDYCFWFSFLTTYLCKFSSKNFFFIFLIMMTGCHRNVALVFLINLVTKVNLISNKVSLNFSASQNQLVIRENFHDNILDTNHKIMNGR